MDRFVKVSTTTDEETGIGIVSIKVPGTFVTLDPTSPSWSGRTIQFSEFWFSSPVAGDAITSMTLEDTDGVIPELLHALFPEYPILGRREDPEVDSDNKGVYMHPSRPTTVIPSVQSGRYASGLYLNVEVKKASPAADTIYANVIWSDIE